MKKKRKSFRNYISRVSKSFFVFFVLQGVCLFGQENFIVGSIFAELGNNFFQVATALALAWDNGIEAYFPEMVDRLDRPFNPQNVPLNYEHVFFRCNISKPSEEILNEWREPSLAYHPITLAPRMRLVGYFQSEKYFFNHRERLLEYFAPNNADLIYVKQKYFDICNHPCAVAVQIRHQYEDPSGKMYIQYGKDYLREILKFFPDNALYVVSSNNMNFAKDNIPDEMKNVFFITDEPHYINLILLTLCKHTVITNSTFGWWSAWLNQNKEQIVIAPSQWYHPNCPIPTHDILPERWIKINAKWGPLEDPSSYQ